MTNMQVAETIIEQIKLGHLRGELRYLNFFKAVNASQLVALDNGIQFRVQGDKFTGKVVIKLNVMDTYDIEFWKVEIEPFVCEKVDQVNDIYNDQLLETLWNRIVYV